jgi:hypothetical protein
VELRKSIWESFRLPRKLDGRDTEGRGLVVKKPALYSEGPGLRSRTGDGVSSLSFIVVYFSHSIQPLNGALKQDKSASFHAISTQFCADSCNSALCSVSC